MARGLGLPGHNEVVPAAAGRCLAPGLHLPGDRPTQVLLLLEHLHTEDPTMPRKKRSAHGLCVGLPRQHQRRATGGTHALVGGRPLRPLHQAAELPREGLAHPASDSADNCDPPFLKRPEDRVRASALLEPCDISLEQGVHPPPLPMHRLRPPLLAPPSCPHLGEVLCLHEPSNQEYRTGVPLVMRLPHRQDPRCELQLLRSHLLPHPEHLLSVLLALLRDAHPERPGDPRIFQTGDHRPETSHHEDAIPQPGDVPGQVAVHVVHPARNMQVQLLHALLDGTSLHLCDLDTDARGPQDECGVATLPRQLFVEEKRDAVVRMAQPRFTRSNDFGKLQLRFGGDPHELPIHVLVQQSFAPVLEKLGQDFLAMGLELHEGHLLQLQNALQPCLLDRFVEQFPCMLRPPQGLPTPTGEDKKQQARVLQAHSDRSRQIRRLAPTAGMAGQDLPHLERMPVPHDGNLLLKPLCGLGVPRPQHHLAPSPNGQGCVVLRRLSVNDLVGLLHGSMMQFPLPAKHNALVELSMVADVVALPSQALVGLHEQCT
mmetsp:Transcript_19766/g.57487  ORF Transcript_19766/g.57487 Transcript_19766/m.57487 type:complete len:543 (+) Transcript_19766:259-1887(+)